MRFKDNKCQIKEMHNNVDNVLDDVDDNDSGMYRG